MSVAATEATPGECRGIAALMISAYSRQLFHGNLVLLRQVIFLGIRHTHTHTHYTHAVVGQSVGWHVIMTPVQNISADRQL